MSERNFYHPIVLGSLLERWRLYRIADGMYGKKPFDIAGCAPNGVAVGLEVKLIADFAAPIPWKAFETHQLSWLGELRKCGAYALIGLGTVRKELIIAAYDPVAVTLADCPHTQMILKHLEGGKEIYTGWHAVAGLHAPQS